MYKIYEKSEITFSILWIIVYIIVTSFAEELSKIIGQEKLLTFLVHIIMCFVIYKWIKKHNFFEKYGLCKPQVRASEFLYFIPLLVPLTCNFWFGMAMNMPIATTLLYIGSMICVGFLEEIIFRGFLFKAMSKDGLKSAIIVSSVTFGIGHIINLFNGSGMELVSNLCQVCYAMAMGFLFVAIFYKGGSLWPCIITHSVVNACSAFEDASATTVGQEILVAVILTVVAAAYAVFLFKRIKKSRI